MGDAGIIDEDVEPPAEARLRLLEHVLRARRLPEVGGAGRRSTAARDDLVGRGLCALAVDIGEQHVRALGSEAAADLAPNATPATGDDRVFPVEPHCLPIPYLARPIGWQGAESTLAGPGSPGYPAAAMRIGRDT